MLKNEYASEMALYYWKEIFKSFDSNKTWNISNTLYYFWKELAPKLYEQGGKK